MPQLREAPVLVERTCVGLDVHARSVVACAIDVEAGEIRTLRVSPKQRAKTEGIVAGVGSLPGPVAVAYEAGPTGLGLARPRRPTTTSSN
jgi:transposase